MKFIVDKLPQDKYDCYFSKWKSFPPIIEKSGEYFCVLTNMICNFEYDSDECHGLKKDKK